MTTTRRCVTLITAAALAAQVACAPHEGAASLSVEQRTAIADTIRARMKAACDLSAPNFVARVMSLYPDTGRVISATGGRITTTRAELEQNIRTFWESTGQNMRQPKWVWDTMAVDVLGPNAAVLTATYRIPHLTPRGMPHVVGGAWTAVFERRGSTWVIVQEHLSDAPPIG
ncbi:MAG TPA: DUF4440 domain-containing protein [Gemmatimonadaceae bacterium]|nr:DUF4440 domain-containing protein [Gemmatimonadaceae bacterium]